MNQVRAYAQLVRLPNVFTAMADILLAALAARSLPEAWFFCGLLLLCSSCLYCGGMVFNDVFDVEQDRHERPFRPIPSGKVARRSAIVFGISLFVLAMVLAVLAGWSEAARRDVAGVRLHWAPMLLAGALVAAILLYDRWLKRSWAGPLGMGSCRFLNVLLGLTVADSPGSWGVHLALVVGVYIAGVTWFARTEARISSQSALTGAAVVMLASLLVALPLPLWQTRGADATPFAFPYLLVGLAFLVGIPVCQAIAGPTPSRVQAAVKRALIGLVVLDAVLATGSAGVIGLTILVLLLPVLLLGRWFYAT